MIEDYDDAILLFDRTERCGPPSREQVSTTLVRRFAALKSSRWGRPVPVFSHASGSRNYQRKTPCSIILAGIPSVAGTRPADIEKDDGYAQDLALIDMNCLARLGAISSSDADNYRTRQLDSLGAYWVAKGENFGSISDEESAWGVSLDQRARIKALCDSKAAYARALDYTKTKNRPDYPVINPDDSRTNPYDTLDQQLTNDDNDALPFTIQTGLARAKRDLKGFPAADVADACK